MIATQALAPISLEELVGRAALQRRVDRKYVLPLADAELLLDLVPPTTRVLQIDGRHDFRYASVYFDTARRDSYLMAARSRRRRFKVRTRAYLDTGSTWLEVKTRQGRFTVKDRIPHPALDQPEQLDRDGAAYVGRTLDGARITGINPAELQPTLHTAYRRTTLHLPDTDSRVTLDTHLHFASAGWDDGLALDLPGLAIVETKTTSHPCAADRILWSIGHRPTRVSKYATGLAALHPELPHTTWRRLVRQLTPDTTRRIS